MLRDPAIRLALAGLFSTLAPSAVGAPPAGEAALQERVEELESQVSELNEAVPLKPGQDEAAEEEEPPFDIGGALRFNYYATRSDRSQRERAGDAGLELFRLDVEGEKNGLLVSAEYRWYPYQHVLHHGWIGVDWDEAGQLRAGVSQVPFGLLPYAAHNYWFGIPYYVGLGDEYDLGLQYRWQPGAWDVRAAFYKNPEVSSPANHRRYGFDVVHDGCIPNPDESQDRDVSQCNRETNQGNLRLAYTLNQGGTCPTEIGASGQYGELYNDVTGKAGERWAAAAHLDMRCGRWNLQLQGGRQVLDPRNPANEDNDTVTFGALAGSYPVASRADLGVINLAYNFPAPWESIDMLTCYNDFSIYAKDASGFQDSRINTTGCAVGAGPLFVYADHIRAESAPYFDTGEALGKGGSGWDTRYNLNIGYYF